MRSNRRNVTIAMLTATFLAAIEVSIVGTAMPTIVSDLGGVRLISWVFAIYLLTTAVTTPIYGKLADLFGRKIVFIVGTVLFLIGSMLCGLAQTMEQLIWFRAFQGIGAGAVLPVTFTIIGDIYTHEERARIQGLFSSVWGVSGIVGPLVGGFFVDWLSWRWIFYINVPFGLASILMIQLFLKENFEKKKKHIDYWGAVTFTIGMTSLLYALLTGGQDHAWNSPFIVSLFAVSAVLMTAFYVVQWRSPEPMLPPVLLRIREIFISNAAGFLASAVLIGLTAYLPLWVQGVLGYKATSSGLTLAPISIGWPVGAVLSGRMLLKNGARFTSVLGMIILLAGTVWLAFATESTPYWVLIAIMFVTGLGFGLSFTVYTVAVQSAVSWNLRGAATSSNTFIRTLGQTVGVAVFGTLFNHSLAKSAAALPHNGAFDPEDMNKLLSPEFAGSVSEAVLRTMRGVLASGLHTVYLVMAVIAALSLLAALGFPKRDKKLRESGTPVPEK